MLLCIQNLVKFCPLVSKILSGNEILTSIKGGNSVAKFDALQSQPRSYWLAAKAASLYKSHLVISGVYF